jgi:hypothetical protein
MQTARMLKTEWRQLLRGSVSTGAKEDESSAGGIWAAGFHHVTVRSRLAGVLKVTYNLFLEFSNFWGGHGELRIMNQWIQGHACTYKTLT